MVFFEAEAQALEEAPQRIEADLHTPAAHFFQQGQRKAGHRLTLHGKAKNTILGFEIVAELLITVK